MPLRQKPSAPWVSFHACEKHREGQLTFILVWIFAFTPRPSGKTLQRFQSCLAGEWCHGTFCLRHSTQRHLAQALPFALHSALLSSIVLHAQLQHSSHLSIHDSDSVGFSQFATWCLDFCPLQLFSFLVMSGISHHVTLLKKFFWSHGP